jgi:hypothetical protein
MHGTMDDDLVCICSMDDVLVAYELRLITH